MRWVLSPRAVSVRACSISLPANGTCLRVILGVFQLRLLFNSYSYVQLLTPFSFQIPWSRGREKALVPGARVFGGLGFGAGGLERAWRSGAQASAGGRRERARGPPGGAGSGCTRSRARRGRAARATGRPVGPGPPPGRQDGLAGLR